MMSLHQVEIAKKLSDLVMCVKGKHVFKFGKPEDVLTKRISCELYN